MNLVPVLRAYGPNSVETIAMVFASLEEGERFMDGVLAPFKHETRKLEIIQKGVTRFEDVPAIEKKVSEDGQKIDYKVHWSVLERQDEEGNYPIHDQIFKSYYDGCGGVFHYAIEMVPTGTKLMEWSLD